MEGFPFCLSYSVLCNLEKSPLSDSIFSTAKWGYSSSPNYWMWLLGGPKGTPGVLYTDGVPAGVESLQHRSHPCLLLLGDDMDVRQLSAVPGISTETLWRGSACSKESLLLWIDKRSEVVVGSTWCQERLQVPLLWHCRAISLFCLGKQPSVVIREWGSGVRIRLCAGWSLPARWPWVGYLSGAVLICLFPQVAVKSKRSCDERAEDEDRAGSELSLVSLCRVHSVSPRPPRHSSCCYFLASLLALAGFCC